MKKLMTTVLLSTAALFSCTKTLYTHQQFMDRFKTQQDVIARFGIPTEKLKSDSTEEWLYRFEAIPPKPDQVNYIQVKNDNTRTVQSFSFYPHTIIFAFDKRGKVTLWYGNGGVDLSSKKLSVGKTVGVVGGLTVGFVLILMALFSNFHIGADSGS